MIYVVLTPGKLNFGYLTMAVISMRARSACLSSGAVMEENHAHTTDFKRFGSIENKLTGTGRLPYWALHRLPRSRGGTATGSHQFRATAGCRNAIRNERWVVSRHCQFDTQSVAYLSLCIAIDTYFCAD